MHRYRNAALLCADGWNSNLRRGSASSPGRDAGHKRAACPHESAPRPAFSAHASLTPCIHPRFNYSALFASVALNVSCRTSTAPANSTAAAPFTQVAGVHVHARASTHIPRTIHFILLQKLWREVIRLRCFLDKNSLQDKYTQVS